MFDMGRAAGRDICGRRVPDVSMRTVCRRYVTRSEMPRPNRDGRFGNGSQKGVRQMEEMRLTQARRSYSRMGLAYFVFFIVAALSQLGAVRLLEGAVGAADGGLYSLIGILAMYPLAFPLSYLIVRTVPKRGPAWQFRMGGARFSAVFVICLGSMLVGNLIGLFLMLIVSLLTGQPMVNNVQELILEMEPGEILLAAVIVAPVLEELLFRKFLLDRVACFGQRTAVFMSAALFALAHGNFYQFFYAFALGAIFAYVYLRTGRIRYTIALHMMVNFSGSIVPILMMNYMETSPLAGSFLVVGWYLILGLSVIGGIALLIAGRRQIWFYRMPGRIPAGKWMTAVCVNAGVILFLIYSAVNFAMA